MDKIIWYTQTTKCYSPINSNEVLIHATAWISFENIMLSKSDQTQKAMYFMICLYEVSRIGKFTEAECRLAVNRCG